MFSSDDGEWVDVEHSDDDAPSGAPATESTQDLDTIEERIEKAKKMGMSRVRWNMC